MPDVSIQWRAWTESDLDALAALDAACQQVDGVPAVPSRPYRDLLDLPHTYTRCAVTDTDVIAAAGWVQRNDSVALLRGVVHPLYRQYGIGTALINQLESEAQRHGAIRQFVMRNEALNAASETLYTRLGYSRDFIELWMRRDLRAPLPSVPRLATCETWTDVNAPQFYTAYRTAFAERISGEPVSADTWIADHTEDTDFRPDLSLLAMIGGEHAGFITTFVTDAGIGFIGQVGSHPRYRGRGIAAGLMVAVMDGLQHEGVPFVDLHVNSNNTRAVQLYERLGFARIGQRGKFSKPAVPSI
ncbi:MAG: GNAT family N-acetyltransferase [Anaerolineae bacterium]|nr:GNAT family N-acetyltransferase [Anaerolineae bacterium]